jgi:hypothetical protein
MLTAWECEKMVWDRVFNQIKIKPSETSLLVTEPYLNLPSLAETFDQMVFEEWEFQSYYRCSRECRLLWWLPFLVSRGYQARSASRSADEVGGRKVGQPAVLKSAEAAQRLISRKAYACASCIAVSTVSSSA